MNFGALGKSCRGHVPDEEPAHCTLAPQQPKPGLLQGARHQEIDFIAAGEKHADSPDQQPAHFRRRCLSDVCGRGMHRETNAEPVECAPQEEHLQIRRACHESCRCTCMHMHAQKPLLVHGKSWVIFWSSDRCCHMRLHAFPAYSTGNCMPQPEDSTWRSKGFFRSLPTCSYRTRSL